MITKQVQGGVQQDAAKQVADAKAEIERLSKKATEAQTILDFNRKRFEELKLRATKLDVVNINDLPKTIAGLESQIVAIVAQIQTLMEQANEIITANAKS